MTPNVDLAIVGGGAAGMAAAIFAAEHGRPAGLSVLLLEGARKPGAKILVSGGGRCNVTNERVTPDDFFGGPRPIIRNVLRAFDEQRTLAWMRDLGVELKLEPTGKYFPVTDTARTVLDALLSRIASLGVRHVTGCRVAAIAPLASGFDIATPDGTFHARRLILASGGRSLPRSGSDGWGLDQLAALGHAIVPTTPSLVPLMLGGGSGPGGRHAELSGVTFDARLSLLDPAGRELWSFTGSTLFTHFGISGPAAMNASRHWLRARLEGVPATLAIGAPDFPTLESADAFLQDQGREHPRRTPATSLAGILPQRLADILAPDPTPFTRLPRDARLTLARNLWRLPLPVTGDRGYSFAETTAGGVDLREVVPGTMESRRVPGLHLCGEVLDVDGRIGGFNFQWAWASGYLAGRGAIAALTR